MAGFFDNYVDEGGTTFLSKEEKQALVKSKTVVKITKVFAFQDTGQYPGPAHMVIFDLDGEERKLSFKQNTGVDSRDKMLDAMIEYFESEGDAAKPVEVTLVKAGNAFLFRDANSSE